MPIFAVPKTNLNALFFQSDILKSKDTSRSGAVVARWAHNPKVTGSSPVSATKKKPNLKIRLFY